MLTDRGSDIPAIDPRSAAVVGERLAVVETKVGALKEDTATIRASIHSINNELQKFAVVEQRCLDALANINSGLEQRTAQIERIATDVSALLNSRSTLEGAWAATVRIAAAAVAAISILGLLATGGAWMLGHVMLR